MKSFNPDMLPVCKPTRSFDKLAKKYQTQYTTEDEANERCWYVTHKYDGKYNQIIKRGDQVAIFTAGGKRLHLPEVEAEVLRTFQNVLNIDLHCEFIGTSTGHLGCRHQTSIQTTWLANQRKGITNIVEPETRWVVYDCNTYRNFGSPVRTNLKYFLRRMIYSARIPSIFDEPCDRFLHATCPYDLATLSTVRAIATELRGQGWEGGVAVHKDHTDQMVPRSPYKLKLKANYKASGVLLDLVEGSGKNTGMVGAIVVSHDDPLIGTVTIGTGWSDAEARAWFKSPLSLIGVTVHYSYESQNKGTPQQCVYQRGLPK